MVNLPLIEPHDYKYWNTRYTEQYLQITFLVEVLPPNSHFLQGSKHGIKCTTLLQCLLIDTCLILNLEIS